MTPKLALTIVQVLCGLILIAVVMLQSGKSAGLSGAIAGGVDTFLSKNVQEQGQDLGLQAGQADQVGGPSVCGAHSGTEPDLTALNKKPRMPCIRGFFYSHCSRARARSGRSGAMCTQGHGAKSSAGVVPFKTAAKSTPARWAASASSTVSPQ